MLCEYMGSKGTFCFPCFSSAVERRRAEDALESSGFKVFRKHFPGGFCAKVKVQAAPRKRLWPEGK
jgi:hypothetical protein